MPRNLSNVDNSVLNNLAKNMGVLVQKESFATFGMIKDLESSRNCLYSKQQQQTNNSVPVEIEEFNLENDSSVEIVVMEDNSDVDEMLFQQTHKKTHQSRRNSSSPQGEEARLGRSWLARFKECLHSCEPK